MLLLLYPHHSPYFFHITVVIENLKNYFQEQKALEEIENTLEEYEISDLDKSSQEVKDKHKTIKELHDYIKQKSHSRKLLAQIFFVSQFVSQILEFLIIKENSKKPYWCSDRDHMATHCHGLLFFWVNYSLTMLLKGRVKDFWLNFPSEIRENKKEYPYDPIIRVPDIITGIMSSMKYTYKGIQLDKTKHYRLFQKLIVNNPKIVTLEYIYQKDGKGYFQRSYWRVPIEGHQYKPFDPDNFKRFTNLPT